MHGDADAAISERMEIARVFVMLTLGQGESNGE